MTSETRKGQFVTFGIS